ncbi:MAG: 4Fe-4S ferredoxin [Candidatus Lokiarchaeota archaeon]|nr:4Fe-4S ferredoxin [Candidatus Lokiarchaeota archaeon]
MTELEIYRKLQQHLDTLPIGYPPTESGVEIRILKFLFTPEEAEIALNLRFIPEPAYKIHRRVKKNFDSFEDLKNKLNAMYQKGAINVKRIKTENSEDLWYHLAFLAVGMYEYQVKSITPEFYMDIETYFDEAYVDEFTSTKINQLRTIPIEKSVEPHHQIATYDDFKTLIGKAENVAVMDCICQKGKDLIGHSCKQTNFREHCFTFNSSAQHVVEIKNGRYISKEEAFKLINKAQEEGLIVQPGNAINPNFICCCCGDCCDLLTNLKKLTRPWELIYSNFFAEINEELCVGCQTCLDRCQMGAISINNNIANVTLNLCLGCGNCIVVCPEEAISLIKKENEVIPPEDTTQLYLKIMDERAKLRRIEKGNE